MSATTLPIGVPPFSSPLGATPSRSVREKNPLELVELLGPALLGTAHRLSGRHRLEVGLSHGERGPRAASLKGHLNERDEELALFVVDISTAHDPAVRPPELVPECP